MGAWHAESGAQVLKELNSRPEGLSRELLDRALDYGSLAGSLCVSRKGAMESLPTAAQIQAVLDGRD